MNEPFDIEIGNITYSVFPEGEGIYTIFKEGVEYSTIQKDTEQHWLKLDSVTEMPLFDNDEETNQIGRQIEAYNE
jgi:hypothetical protein